MKILEAKKLNVDNYKRKCEPLVDQYLTQDMKAQIISEVNKIVGEMVDSGRKISINDPEVKKVRDTCLDRLWYTFDEVGILGTDNKTQAAKDYTTIKELDAAVEEAKWFASAEKHRKEYEGKVNNFISELSDEDKKVAKDWFSDHVTNIVFEVPYADSPDDFSSVGDPEIQMRLFNKFQLKNDQWTSKYRNADDKQFKNRKLRSNCTAKTYDTYESRAKANITLDTTLEDAPQPVKDMYIQAVQKSKDDVLNSKADFKWDSKQIRSVFFADVILGLFDDDLQFYKNKQVKEGLHWDSDLTEFFKNRNPKRRIKREYTNLHWD